MTRCSLTGYKYKFMMYDNITLYDMNALTAFYDWVRDDYEYFNYEM